MKIGSTGSIEGARPTRTSEAAQRYRKAARSADVRQGGDTVSLMGIPEQEMTPKVREALLTLMAEVEALRRDLEATRQRIGELEQLADRDPLTPTFNRRAFVRELTRMVAFTDRFDAPCSVVFFDLNGMKEVNDRYGHAVGDQVLLTAADVLKRHTRLSDVLGRLGGDEFGLILAKADEAQAQEKAAKLAAAIAAAEVDYGGKRLPLSVAYGVHTIYPGDDPAHALEEADRRMYAHKRTMKDETAEG